VEEVYTRGALSENSRGTWLGRGREPRCVVAGSNAGARPEYAAAARAVAAECARAGSASSTAAARWGSMGVLA